MEETIQKTESFYIKLGAKIFCALLLLIGLIWGGRVLYLRVHEQRLMKQSLAALAKGDDRWAGTTARRAFELNKKNADACRVLAKISEKAGQPSAIEWRQQVVNILPASVDDAVALAKTALLFGEVSVAERALTRVSSTANQSAEFHEAKAQIAVSKKDPGTAESEFAEAVHLDPENKLYQLNLAVFQLQSNSADVRTKASTLLQSFLEDHSLRLPAARALRDYAVQRRDNTAILDLAALLFTYPEAEFRDRILLVQVLHQLNHPEFARRLGELQESAAADPAKMFDLLTWMCSEQLSILALDWVNRLPLETILRPPLPAAVATCYSSINDWPGLEQWCKKGAWGGLDYLRHGYLALSLRGQGREIESRGEWNAALKAIGTEGNKLSSLAQEAAKWGWKDEAADVLWILTKDNQRQNAALATLYQYYNDAGNTGQLFRVVGRILEIRPDDQKALNNFAQLSLLLNLETSRAHEIAQRLYERDPKNPVVASTYAYSLYVKGKPQKAVEVMNTLSAEELHKPGTAAYYGIFLAAAGEKDKAAEFLQLGETARLFPEEKALVAKALAR